MSSHSALSDEQKQYISDLNIGSSVRSLMDAFGYSPDQAIEMSLKNKEERRQRWLTGVIDKLAEKHSTNRQAVLSILFDDNRGDITTSDAYKWVECHEFAFATLHELKHPVNMDDNDRKEIEDTDQSQDNRHGRNMSNME